ncbi:hypothetical protein J7M22_16795, partial [Candidatus Poribacteria bacterium]|nr:hypothetical protein [Candidatus Poribacteria bacterium]
MKRFDSFSAFGAGRGDFTLIKALKSPDRRGETLDRGLIALRSAEGTYLSWRLLSSDPRDISFNIYREDENGVHRINEVPISSTTDLLDRSAQDKGECRYILKVERGTYGLIKIAAYDGDLNMVWYFEASGEHSGYRGQGAHGLAVADTDEDGMDELIIGSAVIDHDGRPIWCTGLGHPDVMYVADIDPERPGLEIFYGIEPRHERNAVCLVDARTGRSSGDMTALRSMSTARVWWEI